MTIRLKTLALLFLALLIQGCSFAGDQPDPTIHSASQQKVDISLKTHYGAEQQLLKLSPKALADHSFSQFAQQHPNSCFVESRYHGKKIALTFDDGPGEYTDAMAAALLRNNVKATFFWIGKRAQENPEIAKRVFDAGHAIGNHGWYHNDNLALSPQALWTESIEPTNKIIHDITGQQPVFFRPPFGSINSAQIEYLKQQGLTTVLWSVDTRDWDSSRTRETLANVVIQYGHEGAIVLMHDSGGMRQAGVDAIDAIVKHFRVEGYEFVTLTELLENQL